MPIKLLYINTTAQQHSIASRQKRKGKKKKTSENKITNSAEMARKSKTYQPRPKLSREQLSVIFRNHDGDGDGRLSTTELTAAFRYIGAFLPSYRALHALLHTDSDGDGFIGEKDFELLVNYAEKRKYTVI